MQPQELTQPLFVDAWNVLAEFENDPSKSHERESIYVGSVRSPVLSENSDYPHTLHSGDNNTPKPLKPRVENGVDLTMYIESLGPFHNQLESKHR